MESVDTIVYAGTNKYMHSDVNNVVTVHIMFESCDPLYVDYFWPMPRALAYMTSKETITIFSHTYCSTSHNWRRYMFIIVWPQLYFCMLEYACTTLFCGCMYDARANVCEPELQMKIISGPNLNFRVTFPRNCVRRKCVSLAHIKPSSKFRL